MPPGEDCGVAATPPAPAASVPTVADAPAMPSTSLDWASSVQALCGGGPATPGNPPPFYPPSSSPSPYIWGTQSMAYGIPVSYTFLHPHGGTYAHPAMSPGRTREATAKTFEVLKKASDDSLEISNPVIRDSGDDDQTTSRSADPLGIAGPVTGNFGDGDKAASSSVNVDPSHSDDSGGEGSSSNGRDDENSPCDLSASGERSYNMLFPDLVVSAPVEVASILPATSLNNEMNPWNSSHAGAANMNGIQATFGTSPIGSTTVIKLNKAVPGKQRMQDGHEEKRQRRKLSNRESARRSRERKQKECEEFARQVAELNTQNHDLRSEIDKLNAECKKLEAENASIVEELKQVYGPNALAAIEGE